MYNTILQSNAKNNKVYKTVQHYTALCTTLQNISHVTEPSTLHNNFTALHKTWQSFTTLFENTNITNIDKLDKQLDKQLCKHNTNCTE